MTVPTQIETCRACAASFATVDDEPMWSLVSRYTAFREAHAACVIEEAEVEHMLHDGDVTPAESMVNARALPDGLPMDDADPEMRALQHATTCPDCKIRNSNDPDFCAVAEPVLIASKGTYRREKGRSDLTAVEFKAWTRNVWFITTGHKDQYLKHPAMFPLELPRRLIKLYSYVGDVVLDPFGGSGTTARAARDCGRHAISVDTSARYCRLAAGRTSQATLFEPALFGDAAAAVGR